MKYQLICFDLDGVLFSSEEIIGAAYQQAIENFSQNSDISVEIPSVARIMEEIGKPVSQIFSNLFPNLKLEDRKKISGFVLKVLKEQTEAKKGTLLPGSFEILEALHKDNRQVGLASNGRSPYLLAVLETYNLRPFFTEAVFIDGETLPSKASLILYYMKQFNIKPENTLMIGDRMTDFMAAKEANVDFVLVETGHGSDFSDESIQYRIHNLLELFPIVGLQPHLQPK